MNKVAVSASADRKDSLDGGPQGIDDSSIGHDGRLFGWGGLDCNVFVDAPMIGNKPSCWKLTGASCGLSDAPSFSLNAPYSFVFDKSP